MRHARATRSYIGVHAEGEHFCNRETAVDRIAGAFTDPAARILAAVHEAVGRWWVDAATGLLRRLRPGTFSMTGGVDATGQPSVSFQLSPAVADDDPGVVTDVLDAVEAELGSRGVTVGLALDEFQRLGGWYGADVDWQLKELLERHRHVGYVLAGSQRRLIEQMLQTKRAGLWKVVDVLHLPPIESVRLARWIEERAAAAGVVFEGGLAGALVALAGPRTRDVVQLARAVWDREQGAGWAVRGAEVGALEGLVREQSALYQREWDRLKRGAKRILEVLATVPDLRHLLADETLKTYRLGAKSTVQSALQQLIEDELLVRTSAAGVEYAFDDPFFRRWVQVNAAANLGRTPPPLATGAAPDTPALGAPDGGPPRVGPGGDDPARG